jgi:hypothetical protein
MADEAKVPTIVSVGVICLALGAGVAVATMHFLGYQKPTPQGAAATGGGAPTAAPGMPGAGAPGGMMAGPPGGPPSGMPGMGSGGPGASAKGGMGAGKGGGRGPNPKNQLAALVAKLDLVTGKPLAVQLNDEQKKKVHQQLQGLDAADELNEEDAKKRLDALLDILKEHRETLEMAGYRWPAQGGPGGFQPPPEVPNPFKDDKNAKPLKALQERLGAK